MLAREVAAFDAAVETDFCQGELSLHLPRGKEKVTLRRAECGAERLLAMAQAQICGLLPSKKLLWRVFGVYLRGKAAFWRKGRALGSAASVQLQRRFHTA